MAEADLSHAVALLELQLARERALIDDLKRAVHVARSIGVAIGLVMAEQGTTLDNAFTMLHAAGQRTSRNIGDMAQAVIAAGRLPVCGE